MKKIVKLCVAVFSVLMLVGCGNSFDHQGYVQAMMDASYKGEVSKYVELTSSTEEEALALYEENISAVVDEICASYQDDSIGLSVSDEQAAQIDRVIREIFKSVSYETEEAVKVDNSTYTVNVKVKPLTSLQTWSEQTEVYAEEVLTEIMAGNIEGIDLTDPELTEEALNEALLNMMNNVLTDVMDMLEETANAPTYGDETVLTVEVKLDTDEVAWYVSDADMVKIDEALMVIE